VAQEDATESGGEHSGGQPFKYGYPVAGLVDVEHLGSGDLAQPDRRHIGDVLAEGGVHLLVDPLRFDRHLGEVRLPVLGRLPGRALSGPAREVRQPTGAGAGGGQQRVEGGTGIGDHAVVGGEHASDLRGLDVDVDELAPLPIDAEVTGV